MSRLLIQKRVNVRFSVVFHNLTIFFDATPSLVLRRHVYIPLTKSDKSKVIEPNPSILFSFCCNTTFPKQFTIMTSSITTSVLIVKSEVTGLGKKEKFIFSLNPSNPNDSFTRKVIVSLSYL